jgi:hypothetical protein
MAILRSARHGFLSVPSNKQLKLHDSARVFPVSTSLANFPFLPEPHESALMKTRALREKNQPDFVVE